jgi:hypothetical protein
MYDIVYKPRTVIKAQVLSDHVAKWSEEQSDDSQVDDLTKLEELHKAAINQLAKHQQTMR